MLQDFVYKSIAMVGLINGRINIEKTPRTIALLLLIMTVGIFFYLLSNNIYDTPFALILTFGGIFARTEFNAPVFTKYVINADVFFVGLTATLYGIGAMVANVLINGRINIENYQAVE